MHLTVDWIIFGWQFQIIAYIWFCFWCVSCKMLLLLLLLLSRTPLVHIRYAFLHDGQQAQSASAPAVWVCLCVCRYVWICGCVCLCVACVCVHLALCLDTQIDKCTYMPILFFTHGILVWKLTGFSRVSLSDFLSRLTLSLVACKQNRTDAKTIVAQREPIARYMPLWVWAEWHHWLTIALNKSRLRSTALHGASMAGLNLTLKLEDS